MTTRGFTLIELLVVIAILGLLAALLMPALGRARAQASRAACVSQLHQIQLGCASYANDHSDRYPTAQRSYGFPHEFMNYADVLESYVGAPRDKILFCPGALRRVRNPQSPQYDTHYTTYQYFNFPRTFLGTFAANKPDLSRSSTLPERVPLWGCLTARRPDGTSLAHNEPLVTDFPSGMNAAYGDAHASWVAGDALETFWRGDGLDFYWPKPPEGL